MPLSAKKKGILEEEPARKPPKPSDRQALVEQYSQITNLSREWLKRQILKNNRIDILATHVLGLQVQPFHLELMRYQFLHRENLQLCFRGAGKSTTCTVTKVIHLLLKNPNLRILIASKTIANAKGFLKEIKNHFESNVLLAEIFGKYYDEKLVKKWDETEIIVLPRTSPNKESSVTCVGVEGTVVSKHYDVIISDDLVDEDNSRTEGQRTKNRTWYYMTLMPTLEPPDPNVEHRGEHHHLGTRYHWADLWGHLIANELKDHHQIIPALDKNGRSPWPDKYPPAYFKEKRKRSGLIIFNAQFQCDTEAMKGEIFSYDDCQELDESQFPSTTKGLRVFMGVDLAITEDEKNDKFAIVVLGINKTRTAFYVLDFYEDNIRFSEQTRQILKYRRKWDPIRIGIETNQYQLAQYQELKEKDPDIRLKKINTDKDKISRAWKLSPIFEEKKVFFRKGVQNTLIDRLVLFPNDFKDPFDAFDHAVRASKMRGRGSRREEEPELI
jgi:phage terminase large subunit-like protein